MKVLVISFVLMSFYISSRAQSPISLGLKVGYNSSRITSNSNQFNEGSVNNYHAGAFLRVDLGRIYLQPEAYFNSKGGVLTELGGNPVKTINAFDLKTIDVPLLIGVNVIKNKMINLRVNAGPLMSFFTNKDLNSEVFVSDNIKNNFFGWQYGVGVDVLFLTIDARMENSAGNIYAGTGIEQSKSKSFVLSLGFKIL